MDPQKFTEKSLLALEASLKEATRRQNTQIISIHLLQALVAQENGLIQRLLERMEMKSMNILSRRDMMFPLPLMTVTLVLPHKIPNLKT